MSAAIVELRQHHALKFSIQSVRATLPDWTIHVFTGYDNHTWACEELKDIPLLEFHQLSYQNLNLITYSCLLTTPSFYDYFDTEFVLIFQTDTVLFPQSPYLVTYFMNQNVDYIGAPWFHLNINDGRTNYVGGNGGLSLRKVSRMKELLTRYPYAKRCHIPEDVYICRLPDIQLPHKSIAERFSVESIFHPCPFGTHKPWITLNMDEYLKMIQYAPILKTLIDFQS